MSPETQEAFRRWLEAADRNSLYMLLGMAIDEFEKRRQVERQVAAPKAAEKAKAFDEVFLKELKIKWE